MYMVESFSLLALHVNSKVDESVGVSPFVIIPADHLVEVFG
jgi:hypothetical protein